MYRVCEVVVELYRSYSIYARMICQLSSHFKNLTTASICTYVASHFVTYLAIAIDNVKYLRMLCGIAKSDKDVDLASTICT